MPEPSTCHLPNITAFFCTGVEHLDRAGMLQRPRVHIVVSDITELGGRQ